METIPISQFWLTDDGRGERFWPAGRISRKTLIFPPVGFYFSKASVNIPAA
jgi:hypothetical protein